MFSFLLGSSQIWQGSHAAAHPVWANDQKFQCVLTIADPRLPDKKLAWLDHDEDIDHLRVEAEVGEGFSLVRALCRGTRTISRRHAGGEG